MPTKKILLFVLFFISISFAQDSTYQKISRMIDSVSKNNLTEHIINLVNAGGHGSRVSLTPGNDSAAFYIKREFEKIPGLTSVTMDTFYITDAVYPYNQKPMFNIVAEIRGKVTPGTQYVIGAHYDCSASRMGSSIWTSQWKTIQAPGADDNATGVAIVLELARILSDTANHFNPDYTIKLVAFGAEESGPAYSGHHYGSIHYAKNAKLRNDYILGMLSIDMVGYNDNYNYNSIISDANSKWLGEKMVQANQIFSTGLLLNATPFVYGNYSDHFSFWEEGYKAICLMEFGPPWNNGPYYIANPFYHKTSDTLGTVNMELVKRIGQLSLATFASLTSRFTDVKEEIINPTSIYLSQNYPNPFNPSTNIKVYLPVTKNIKLKVYDMLGKEVVELYNGELQSGEHEFKFDGSQLSSGIYMYVLKTDELSISKKMLLIK